MKLFVTLFAVIFFCLAAAMTPARAQTSSNSASSSPTKPSANRFSSTASNPDVTSTPIKTTTAATRRGVRAANDQWYTLALAAFLSLRYLFWILGFTLFFCVLSAIFAHTMYRSHQPQSAYGVARWSVFWALLVCSLLPLLLPFVFAWSWIAWLLVSFPFTILTLILLMILLTNRPARIR